MRHFIKIPLLLSLFWGVEVKALSQNKIYYTYDAAGDRVSREVVQSKSMSAKSLEASEEQHIDGIFKNYKIDIYNNPSSGSVRVMVSNMTGGEVVGAINVYGIDGIFITKQAINVSGNFIDLGVRHSGVYILQVEISGELASWKIVKK